MILVFKLSFSYFVKNDFYFRGRVEFCEGLEVGAIEVEDLKSKCYYLLRIYNKLCFWKL